MTNMSGELRKVEVDEGGVEESDVNVSWREKVKTVQLVESTRVLIKAKVIMAKQVSFCWTTNAPTAV